MGANKFKYMLKKMPIKVVLFKCLKDSVQVETTKGLTEVEIMRGEDRVNIERAYLVIKTDNKFRRIPRPPTRAFYGETGRRMIYLLQYDSDTFYPLIWAKGSLNVLVTEKVIELDEKGQPKQDESGQYLFRIQESEKPFLDARFVNENGVIKELPIGVAYKTFDKEQWLGTELYVASTMYKVQNFFTQYAPHILVILFGLMFLMTAYVMVDGINKNAKINQATAVEISQKNLQFLDKWAEINSNRATSGGYTTYVNPSPPPS